MENIEKIYDSEYEDFYNSDCKNRVFRGLEIMSKYSDDLEINPAHDEIYAGFKDSETYDKMSGEDIRAIFNLNWGWDEESFRIFT